MPDLTPIPTTYQGYRFRSRLEARWAVFFDALGLQWRYEDQGYVVGGAPYLPDFVLPQLRAFAEIKPRGEFVFHPRCQQLAVESGQRVLHIVGDPWLGEYAMSVYFPDDTCTGGEPCGFALGRRDDREVWVIARDESFHISLTPADDSEKLPLPDAARLLAAYSAARSARFEHGERGRTRP